MRLKEEYAGAVDSVYLSALTYEYATEDDKKWMRYTFELLEET